MKETFYFRHDYSARNDERILELRSEFGWEGYGLYWAIIETIAENDNGGINSQAIGGLSIGLNYPKDQVKKLLDFCIDIGLFVDDDGFIHSKRFDEHLEFRGKLSAAGKDGAEKRWGKNRGANRGAIANPMQSTVQESKEKKKKELIESCFIFDDFWSIYPKKVQKQVCEKAYAKVSETEREKIKRTINTFIKHKPFKDYTHPNPSTYLNQKRWNDEIIQTHEMPQEEKMCEMTSEMLNHGMKIIKPYRIYLKELDYYGADKVKLIKLLP